MPTPTTVGASDVALDAIQASVQRTFQRKAFFALGRHWVFYVNDAGALVYDSSVGDSEVWLGPVALGSATSGREFSVFLNASPTTAYVHLVWADITGNSPVIYIRGTLSSDGTISWDAPDDAVPLDVGYEYENLSICMGYDGYIYIAYNKVEAADPTNTTPYVCMSTTTDGTWTTGSGYPLQITAVQDGSWIPLISPYGTEVIVVYTSISGSIYSRVLSSGVWGAQVDTGFVIGADSTKISIVSETARSGVTLSARAVHVAYQAADWDLYSIRYENDAWQGAPANTIQVIGAFREASPMLSILDTGDSDEDHPPTTLYCFWTPTTDIPTAEWVTYRVSRDLGDTWTNEAGADAAEVWIDETGDGFEVQASGSAYSFSGSDYANAEFYIGLVYVVHRMPPCLRHAALGFADPYENLLGEFIVRQERILDLSGEFIIRHVGTPRNLPGEFIVRHSATLNLSGAFNARHTTGIANLPGEFIIRHETSVDLPAEFESQTSIELPGEFIIRHETSADLLGEFILRNIGEVNLPGEFNTIHSAILNLPGEFIIRRSATADLAAEFYVNADAADLLAMFFVNQSDEDLPGEFIVRQERSVNLPGEFVIQGEQDENLPGEFIVRQETEVELEGEFVIRKDGLVNLAAEFVVRHIGTPVNLPGEFIIRNVGSANLPGEFIIRHEAPGEDLPAEFIIRHDGSVDLFAQFRLDKNFISKGLNVSVYRDLLVIG